MLVHYHVKYYNEIDDKIDDSDGFVCGRDYNEIVENLEKFYGPVESFTLHFAEDSDSNIIRMDDVKDILSEMSSLL